MIYLVTGGAGFIGAHLARRLLREGNEVIAFDHLIMNNSIHQVLEPGELERVRLIRGDVTDRSQLLELCQEIKPDRIVHLAALLGNDITADPARAIRTNCESNANVLDVARRCEVGRVVWASSIMVYGPPRRYSYEFLPNDAPHFPPDLYGACKSLDEALGRHYLRVHGVDNVGLRFTIVYGPGRMRGGGQFSAELINKPALGQSGVVAYGDETMDWLYVDDAARYIILAAEGPMAKTRAFNTHGDLRTVAEAVAWIKHLLPDADLTVLPGRMGMTLKMDASAIESALGARPQWSMEDGIRATVNALRARAGLPLVG